MIVKIFFFLYLLVDVQRSSLNWCCVKVDAIYFFLGFAFSALHFVPVSLSMYVLCVCVSLTCYKFQFIILFISRRLSCCYCLSCLVRCFFSPLLVFILYHFSFVQRYLINRPRSQTQQAMRIPAESAGFVFAMNEIYIS